jgi:predicted transcriptional regulator
LENYSSLLFELASVDRLDILFLLKKTPMKLSHISNKLNFTVQETSRNMARLIEAEVITKDVDGLFHLTPYGEEALNLLSGFRFLFEYRKYFATHTLRELPQEFRESIGMLNGSEFINDVMITFHNVEKMIANAEEHVWILTNQVLASTIPYLKQAVERETEFRLMMPQDYLPLKSIRE